MFKNRMALFAASILMGASICIAEPTPDAQITFDYTSIAAGIGGGAGKGVLKYKGYHIPFEVSGFSVIDAGITKKEGIGFVYNLENLADFGGKYSARTGDITVLAGRGFQRLSNDKKVFIEVKTKQKGIGLSLSAGKLEFELDENAVKRTLASLNAPKKKAVFKSVYFDLGSSKIREDDKPKLQELVGELRKGKATEVQVVGYTDTTGTLEKNAILSAERAENVYSMLKQLATQSGLQTVPPKRIDVFGKGEAGGPKNDKNQANRRVDIAVVYDIPKEKTYR